MNRCPLLLLGLGETAIMTARCFKKTGIEIYGLDYDKEKSGFFSNQIKAQLVESPILCESKWLESVLTWIRKKDSRFVLIPTSDEFVFLSSKFKRILDPYALSIIPDYSILQNFIDRGLQFKSVSNFGIEVPKFRIGPINSYGSIGLKYPFVIKPLFSTAWKKVFNKKVIIVKCQNDLKINLDLVNRHKISYLSQEIIDGDNCLNYEVNSLFLPNDCLISHTIRKVRQLPDNFGTATCIETCRNIEIESLAEKIIRKHKLIGFSNIEFKYSKDKQTYFYIETNTRVWHQINFSKSIGLNYPLMYYEYLTQTKVMENYSIIREGKWLDLAPDFLYYLKYKRKYNLNIIKWLKSIYPVRSWGLFSLNDPHPFLKQYNYGLDLMKTLFRKNK